MEAKQHVSWSVAFNRFARGCARATGKPAAFVLAVTIIIVWAICGPIFKYDNSWQLVINTGTTIITFLMIFLIQNTQNRESDAVHIKLDELIRALSSARNSILNCETLTDEELEHLQQHYEGLAKIAQEKQDTREHHASKNVEK